MNCSLTHIIEAIMRYNSENGNEILYSEDEPLSAHSSFRIGGNADIYAMPQTISALRALLSVCHASKTPSFVIGRGSNLLFDDRGFRGVIISTSRISEISVRDNILTAHCGASLSDTVRYAKNHSLGGISYLYGIPGSVGGAVYMNAGAYGGEIADTLISSTYLDTLTDEIVTINVHEHNFGYRSSCYTNNKNRVILSAELSLVLASSSQVETECADFIKRRKEKQPLEYPSAGSSFKRAPGYFTAQLIDSCGLKGFRVGDAAVSEKHAGFIINLGHASSKDVLQLMKIIEQRIFDSYGVRIEREVIHVCPTLQI